MGLGQAMSHLPIESVTSYSPRCQGLILTSRLARKGVSDELSLSSFELKPTWRVPHLGNGGLHLEKEFANKVGIMSVALGRATQHSSYAV